MWSLRKPTMKKNSDRNNCKVAGSYSLTPNGVDDLYFMENSKKETILECFKSLRAKNPNGVILLIIDNFRSHTSTFIKEEAIKLNIELCYFTCLFSTIAAYRKNLERYETFHVRI